MKDYRFLGYSKNDKFCINGLDVFKYDWIMLGKAVVVINPSDNVPKNFSVYKIKINDTKEIYFIAGKETDGNWAFFDYE